MTTTTQLAYILHRRQRYIRFFSSLSLAQIFIAYDDIRRRQQPDCRRYIVRGGGVRSKERYKFCAGTNTTTRCLSQAKPVLLQIIICKERGLVQLVIKCRKLYRLLLWAEEYRRRRATNGTRKIIRRNLFEIGIAHNQEKV